MAEILGALILLSIVAAIIAVLTPNILHAVISLGAVGFMLSIVFVFLAAPDVAIVLIGVEVISLVILVRATIGRDTPKILPPSGSITTVVGMTLTAIVGLFGFRVFAEFPEFGMTVMDRFADAPSSSYLRDGLADTGAPNIVTAVLLDFRAYDTLGEATVLLCAVVGALAILRRKARVETGSSEDEPT